MSSPPLTVCEAITACARSVLPIAAAKGLVLLNDFVGPRIRCNAEIERLSERIDHLLHLAAELTPAGCLLFSTEVREQEAGVWVAETQIAATGLQLGAAALAAVLPRGAPIESEGPAPDDPAQMRTVRALCPDTGAFFLVASKPHEGTLVLIVYPVDLEPVSDQDVRDAQGAMAWLVADHPLAFGTLPLQLQRLGWRVRRFPSAAAASAALDETGVRMPALVLGVQSGGIGVSQLEQLAARLPEADLVLGYELGGPHQPLQAEGRVREMLLPLGPSELFELTARGARLALAARPGAGEREPPVQEGLRALVVDDNPVNRLLAFEMLRILGFQPESAINADEAFRSCETSAPDVVLMDLQLPGMDGLDTARELRARQQDGRLPAFPIVAATAYVSDDDERLCREAGMDAYLPKPLDLRALQETLQRVTQGQGRGAA
ncbi:response regulator [Aquabacterium sp. A7-Y]|uniref:response regulator n=1 Tax=Aquabacterium sp. A7-Y TaxID=1349605 RepID=UPI00223DEEBB|nr:response regulator [Aquabacterium sp. A7-Y]MCW7537573.1 response regulator [Aquabacterium sp. A7-Y]